MSLILGNLASGLSVLDKAADESKERRVRKFATILLLITLSIPLFTGCGSGVTVETDSPVDIPEQVEAGGVTVETPEVNVGPVSIDPEEDRITAK